MFTDQAIGDDPPFDEMFLNNALENRGITFSVPGTFGVHDSNGAAFADAQAVRLRAQDAALLRQLQLLEAPLEELPRRKAALLVAALRLCLVAAEKDVPPGDRNADACGDVALGIGHAQEV
jgi:hypothetical protein